MRSHAAACLVAALWAGSASARPRHAEPPAPPPDPNACGPAIQDAERRFTLPGKLLGTIAFVEAARPDPATGRWQPWPWTINARGVGSFYESKDDAIAAVRALQAAGVQSIDVGCMQINLVFHPDAFASLDEAFEPAANARYGARFLQALYHQTGSWPQAAAAYHSQTPELGADYETKVMALWPLASQYPDPALSASAAGRKRDAGPKVAYTAEFAAQLKQLDDDLAHLAHTTGTVEAPVRTVAYKQAAQRGPRYPGSRRPG